MRNVKAFLSTGNLGTGGTGSSGERALQQSRPSLTGVLSTPTQYGKEGTCDLTCVCRMIVTRWAAGSTWTINHVDYVALSAMHSS